MGAISLNGDSITNGGAIRSVEALEEYSRQQSATAASCSGGSLFNAMEGCLRPSRGRPLLKAGLARGTCFGIKALIRKDPVQLRVAIPAADPPDNIPHANLNASARAPCVLM